ncbi:TPA: metal ABC transporter permease [Legionella pneumophila]|uniref:ABC transporter permease n=1 Tax=Legionella jordanis TaxID=456 RepID=A0A0W0V9M1_9GAMM|nr:MULTISPECIES: metal ABC transporter permease [Legionella]KTD16830.1 ABC transporter permease [Legionella jordanis]MCK1847901.1 metal ABC transporter permease [Legionella pneumophila]RMW99100.1 metal ABC transporter permease [Legionella jordanis]VEH11701.1 ABC transporter permease [Legionella jordanis]HAT1880074.1 metal ABC transporter permease [Legionella pneumophila]
MNNQLILSLIAGIFIGGVSGYLGSLMLSKRMALVAGPLGHLTLPGIAIALLYGFSIALGAFPFVLLGIVFIWLLELRTKLPMEALTAVVFASGVAVAFLFLPIEQAQSALIGDITKISYLETVSSVSAALFLFLIIKLIYPKMVLINISEDLAQSEGINVKKYNFIYLTLIAIVVAIGVQMVGGLLTAALVSIPPASARNLSQNLTQYSLISTLVGAVASCVGVLLFQFTGLPSGPLIILTSTFIFLISLIFKK